MSDVDLFKELGKREIIFPIARVLKSFGLRFEGLFVILLFDAAEGDLSVFARVIVFEDSKCWNQILLLQPFNSIFDILVKGKRADRLSIEGAAISVLLKVCYNSGFFKGVAMLIHDRTLKNI